VVNINNRLGHKYNEIVEDKCSKSVYGQEGVGARVGEEIQRSLSFFFSFACCCLWKRCGVVITKSKLKVTIIVKNFSFTCSWKDREDELGGGGGTKSELK